MNRRSTIGAIFLLFTLSAAGQTPGSVAPPSTSPSPPAPTPSTGQMPAPEPTAPGPATPAPRPHSLSFQVTPVSQGSENHLLTEDQARRLSFESSNRSDGHTASTSGTSVTYSKTKLQISVRNLAQRPDSAQIEGYFFAVPIQQKSSQPAPPPAEFVFDHPTRIVSVPAGATSQCDLESLEVRPAATRKAWMSAESTTSSQRQEGTALRGWLVRLVADGKVLAVQASNSGYEAIGRDEDKLRAALAVPAPYEAKNRHSVGPFNK